MDSAITAAHGVKGSHFAPQDAPDPLVDDIRAFSRPLRPALSE